MRTAALLAVAVLCGLLSAFLLSSLIAKPRALPDDDLSRRHKEEIDRMQEVLVLRESTLAKMEAQVKDADEQQLATESMLREALARISELEKPKVVKEPPPPYQTVQVWYATDRDREKQLRPKGPSFGLERAELSFGVCVVTIPRDHRLGEIESPSITKLEWKEDREKHVTLQSVTEMSVADLFSQLRLHNENSPQKEALVFVHGYNVTFDDAALRTAQLAYDLNFHGTPIFYSWPSHGSIKSYISDESNAEWTMPHLKDFLTRLATESGATSIYLIGHSMGNRCMTGALQSMAAHGIPEAFKEIVLTAPDIDADVFKQQIFPALKVGRARVTLYASSKDEALVASASIHGGHLRVGEVPPADKAGSAPVVLPPMETIDASAVDTSFLGHCYYGDCASVISDLYYLMRTRLPASERFGLKARTSGDQVYWAFLPRKPD